VRNSPLKSVVHASLAIVIGANGDAAGCAGRSRRRRGAIRPCALRTVHTVDRLGHAASGSSRMATPSSFFAPQRGWRLRSFTSRSTKAAAVVCGLREGRRERSSNPTTPSASYRSTHLYPVGREMP
jgi:hypothetical protein